ncbi:MAG: MazF family transcriptional regulator [Rickettsiales bacterium]|nr:MAG: MazF family transcriptional regulator [Rickettsiales bacterium]
MQAQIQKWGNSLGIRIPKLLSQKLNLHSGSQVEIDVARDHLIIVKSSSELDMLLDKINDDNRHHEIFDDDKRVGNESW